MSGFNVDRALEQTYAAALKTATKKLKLFLRKYKAAMDGSYPPPAYYIMSGREKFWLDGFVNALMREYEVIDTLTGLLAECRGTGAQMIMRHLQNEFGHGRLQQIKTIVNGCKQYGFQPSFTMMDKRAIRIAVDDSVNNAPMSKIKVIDSYDEDGRFCRQYIDMRGDDLTRRRLQREFGDAIANGESQRKLMGRIRDVFGTEAANEKRIAQTEGTRIRNQARYEADQEALGMGIEMQREWACRFNHSRDGHMEMDGQVENEQGGWNVPWSSGKKGGMDFMRYPGDPSASPANVINCHCTVVSRVKSESPALAAYRARNEAAREAWKAENAEQNNWRDRMFGPDDEHPQGKHPYAR